MDIYLKVSKKEKELIDLYNKILANKDLFFGLLVKFFVCESCYKILLLEYRRQMSKSTNINSLKINVGEVKRVCKYYKYTISDDILEKIFSSQSNKNNMSMKKIRDFIVHSLKQNVIDEVINRNAELNAAMDVFLDALK